MTETHWAGQYFAVPNLLTASRVLAGCLVPLVWYPAPELVFALVLWAGLSDFLDGWWARRFGVRTPLGVVADPLADKLFVFPVLALFAGVTKDPMLCVLLITNTAYDIDNTYRRRFEIGAALVGRYETGRARPVTWLSKGKTAVLFGFLALLSLSVWLPDLPLGASAGVSLLFVLAAWVQSRAATLLAWIRPPT